MDHANLGASSAKRWMNCTASPALIATIPDILQSRSSIFAEEGSAAHALAEHVVRSWCEFRMGTDEHAKHPLCIDWTGQVIAKPADPELEQWNEGDDYWFYQQPGVEGHVLNVDGHEIMACDSLNFAHPTNRFEVTEEMQASVFLYLREIIAQVDTAIDPEIRIETRCHPLENDPTVFGTADCIVTDKAGGEIWVTDFKYGKGVKVTAPYNPQAMFYAAGAAQLAVSEGHTWNEKDQAHVVIVQPRVEFSDGTSVSSWRTSVMDLLGWRTAELQVAVDNTADVTARKYEAGEYCRWCAAASLCPLLQAQAMETAKEAFADDLVELPYEEAGTVELILPNATDDVALSEAMKIAAVLENWTKKVRELADHRQRTGGKLPGFKMVRRRTNRRWIDEALTTQTLRATLGTEEMESLFTSKLKSPTQMEKAGIDKDLVGSLTEKPEGGLVLAPEGDPRKESMTAISAFGDEPIDD